MSASIKGSLAVACILEDETTLDFKAVCVDERLGDGFGCDKGTCKFPSIKGALAAAFILEETILDFKTGCVDESRGYGFDCNEDAEGRNEVVALSAAGKFKEILGETEEVEDFDGSEDAEPSNGTKDTEGCGGREVVEDDDNLGFEADLDRITFFWISISRVLFVSLFAS
mmetsp:Transcript_7229/g.11011  ORF Transcript_7229/g.11011 Transcript_7229/m.11011 type:complete len:170 (-) Transcript_7229:4454-4963(-)